MKISQRCRLPITWLVIYTFCSPIFPSQHDRSHSAIVARRMYALEHATSNTRFSHFPRGDLDFNRRSYPRQRNTHSETVRAEDRAVTESVARSRALYFCLPLSGSLTLSLSHSHPLIHPPSHSPVLSLSLTLPPLSLASTPSSAVLMLYLTLARLRSLHGTRSSSLSFAPAG